MDLRVAMTFDTDPNIEPFTLGLSNQNLEIFVLNPQYFLVVLITKRRVLSNICLLISIYNYARSIFY
jgi:hypothetical protein